MPICTARPGLRRNTAFGVRRTAGPVSSRTRLPAAVPGTTARSCGVGQRGGGGVTRWLRVALHGPVLGPSCRASPQSDRCSYQNDRVTAYRGSHGCGGCKTWQYLTASKGGLTSPTPTALPAAFETKQCTAAVAIAGPASTGRLEQSRQLPPLAMLVPGTAASEAPSTSIGFVSVHPIVPTAKPLAARPLTVIEGFPAVTAHPGRSNGPALAGGTAPGTVRIAATRRLAVAALVASFKVVRISQIGHTHTHKVKTGRCQDARGGDSLAGRRGCWRGQHPQPPAVGLVTLPQGGGGRVGWES